MYNILEPRSRWVRDAAVGDLIEHMDSIEEKALDKDISPWELLTVAEIRAIEGELRKCRLDFVYAARNYFWIADDRGNETPFCLWDSQELIYSRMQELKAKGKAQKVLIIKSRRLGCSTLIEGLIAWDTMFFTNRTGLVVSYDRDHTKDLLGIMLRIYDKCPWWIKPRVSSRTFESGLVFDNPSHEMRRHDPGTQSKVMLKGANSINGVGQGYRISSAHCSEWTSWQEFLARQIIEEDLAYALQPDSFAFLESTAKGANNFSHRFWKRCEELADESQWSPLFLPWFVDRTHVLMPKANQYFEPHVLNMRERASDDWVRCTDEKCKKYFNRWKRRIDQSMSECPSCHIGLLEPLFLTDEQLMWMQDHRNNAKDDEESQKNLAQEQAGTCEEAFVVTGYQVFGKAAQDFANSSVRKPILSGFFDNQGRIHAVDPKRAKLDEATGDIIPNTIFCIIPDCKEDHTHDTCPLRIWEYPDPTATYYLGADVSEGLGGNCDYSVGVVIRMSSGTSIGPTYQVATWRSNRTGTQDFAEELAKLGRYYNEAEISVEVNKYDTVLTWLRSNIQYPNLYRWKHMDSINPMSNKLGWYTNQLSRPRLHQNFRRFLEYKMFYVRSSNAAEEMKNFVKDDYDDRMAGADSDSHDDEILSLMIALWCAYEGMFDETRGYIPLSKQSQPEECSYLVQCVICGHKDYTNFIPMEGEQNIKCGNEKCKSIRVIIQPTKAFKGIKADPKQMLEDIGALEYVRGSSTPEYWEL